MESTPDRPGTTGRTETGRTESDRPRLTGPMIAALVTVAVLVLTVGIGGSILVYRALAPEEAPPDGTEASGVITESSARSIHIVFDVPIGSDPASAHVDLSSNAQAGSGILPLGG